MAESELRERFISSPTRRESKLHADSIRVRGDRASLIGQPQRATFRTNRNQTSFNQFTQALIDIPKDNSYSIVFPWDEALAEFVIEDEAKVAAVENVTRDDINMVFAKLKESPYYDLYGNMHYKLMAPFVLLLAAIVIFLLFFQDSFKETKNSNIIVVTFFAIFAVIFLLIVVVSIFWAKYLKHRLAAREEDFSELLKHLNLEYFTDKDVFWKCGKFGTYVQLELNYKYKEMDDLKNNSQSAKNMISINMSFEQTDMLAKVLQEIRK